MSKDINYSNEERSIKEIIIALCLKYKLRYQFVNDIVFIYSIIDEWYFQYNKKGSISLFHRNKLHSTKDFHRQKRKFKNVLQCMQYIKKHDKFFYEPNANHKYDLVDKLTKKYCEEKSQKV